MKCHKLQCLYEIIVALYGDIFSSVNSVVVCTGVLCDNLCSFFFPLHFLV